MPASLIDNNEYLSRLLSSAHEGHLCQRISEEIPPHPYLVQDKDRLYLLKDWNKETELIDLFKNLLDSSPDCVLTFPSDSQDNLTEEQKKAIQVAFQERLSFITGGPGTGKTFTAGKLVKYALEQNPHLKIALSAPTGKASLMLKESFERSLENFHCTAETLHRLLKEKKQLPYDLYLIDESSMIDVDLMVRLFSSVKPGARLVLLGDPDQLPPVEAGSVFQDLFTFYSQKKQAGRLTHCLRSELKEIVDFAALIRLGQADDLIAFLKAPERDCIHWSEKITAKEALKPPILSPLKKGLWGTERINKLLLNDALSKNETRLPIMITKNDADLSLFNGMGGALFLKEPRKYFMRMFGDSAFINDATFPALALPPFDFAFSLSIHKSQGSEFDEVRLILPEGSEEFGRAGLYTAATRVKRKLYIFGSEDTLRKMVQNVIKRDSGIVERLMRESFTTDA